MKRTITHDQALAVLEQFIQRGQRAQRAVLVHTTPAPPPPPPITALDLLKLANAQMETCDCRPCTHCARELVAEAIDMLEAERH